MSKIAGPQTWFQNMQVSAGFLSSQLSSGCGNSAITSLAPSPLDSFWIQPLYQPAHNPVDLNFLNFDPDTECPTRSQLRRSHLWTPKQINPADLLQRIHWDCSPALVFLPAPRAFQDISLCMGLPEGSWPKTLRNQSKLHILRYMSRPNLTIFAK